MDNLVTEIRSFYSLKEIREGIEAEIIQYKSLVDDYSQWLGSFLRDSQATLGDEEWFKKLSEKQKALKTVAKSKKGEKIGKTKKIETSIEWIHFKDIMLCASEQGEAEILFEAMEEINNKIEKLEKLKATLEDLEKTGLGKDIVYIAYVHDGIPEKIVLRHKKGVELAEKFKFIADFSATKTI